MPRPLPTEVQEATHGDLEAIRGHILDAAHRVIAGHGLAGASTRAIAAEAGVGAGTIYNYFDDRRHLLVRAIMRRAQHTSRPLDDLAARAGTETVAENLKHHAGQVANILGELVPLFAATFFESDLLDALRHHLHSRSGLEGPFAGQPVERYLAAEQELGRVATDADCRAAASLFNALCHDQAFRAYFSGKPVDAASLNNEIELITRALTREVT